MSTPRRRVTVAAAAALTAALSLTACGMGGGSATEDPTSGGAPKPEVDCEIPAENLTADKVDYSGELKGGIKFATQGLKADFADFFDPLIAKFQTAHPGVTITWEDTPSADDFDARMVTDARTCVMADVVNVPPQTIQALSAANLLVDVDNKAPDLGKRFTPALWDEAGVGHDGHHTALPWYWTPSVVTYNKTLFRKAGLDPEKPPTTFQERTEMGLKLAKAAGGKYQSQWGNSTWTLVDEWLNAGVTMMNEENTQFTFADDPAALEWLTDMRELYAAGAVPQDSLTGPPNPGKAFNEGTLAFGAPGPSFLRNVKKNNAALYPNTGVGTTMRAPGNGVNAVVQYIAVSTTTKNLPLAMAWADFVTNAENQLAWNKNPNVVIFPTIPEVLKDPFYSSADTKEALGQARSVAAQAAKEGVEHKENFIVSGKITTIVQQAVQQAMTGAIAPADALKQAQEEANSLLDSARKR